MSSRKGVIIFIAALTVAGFLGGALAVHGAQPVKVEMKGERCQATLVLGDVLIKPADKMEYLALEEGDHLYADDTVRTLAGARVQVTMPDGSMVRFDEDTEFVISEVEYNYEKNERKVGVRLLLGKTWANIRRFFTQVGGFQVQMPQAVAGIRGTVFRANVYRDTSSLVRCYTGSVKVFRRPVRLPSPGEPGSAIQRVPGPRRVAGPRRVSMQEWIRIVEAMQQVTIGPDGMPSPARRFTPEEDINDWVRWNQELDRQAGISQ